MKQNFFYLTPRWRDLRLQVIKRDCHRCIICGATGKGLTVDHIVPIKENYQLRYDMANLRTLCKSCDNKRHSEKGRNGKQRPAVDINGYNRD